MFALANKAKTTLTKRPMGAPEGRSDTAYRLICLAQFFDARLARFIYIWLTAEIAESLLQAAARGFGDGRVLPLRRAGGASRHSEWVASAQPFVRAP